MSIVLLLILSFIGVPPCQAEDSNNCYWNAAASGNGEGKSFLVINGYVIPVEG